MTFNETETVKRKPIDEALFGHGIAFGGSGSGKTSSVMAPKMREILASRNKHGEEAAVLVIDAKNEYQQLVGDLLSNPERLIALEGREKRFNPFEAEIDKPLVDKVMKIYDSCEGTSILNSGNNTVFAAGGRATMRSFMILDQAYVDKTGRSLFSDVNEFQERVSKLSFSSAAVKKLIEEDKEITFGEFEKKTGPDAFDIELVLSSLCYDPDYFTAFSVFIDSTLDMTGSDKKWNQTLNWAIFLAKRVNIPSKLYGFLSPFRVQERSMVEQWYYKVSYFQSMFSLLLNETVRNYCDLDPLSLLGQWNVQRETKPLLPHWDRGGVVLLKLNPAINEDEGFDFVGRMLKSMFFKHTFNRENLERPVAYICDEFHRFITVDRESGEQNYLDRCRSYNAVCLLATQSIQSIKEAAKKQSGSDESDAIEILLNNTANKYFFRTTDVRTQEYLEKLVPPPMDRNMRSVAEIRRLSTLEQGQCYAFFSNGDWALKQIALAEVNTRKDLLMSLVQEDCTEWKKSAEMTLC